jgi:hypothetical protein
MMLERLIVIERRWLLRLAAPVLGPLLAHLLFMATPAHAGMLAPGLDQAHLVPESTTLLLELPHGDHCAVEWTTPARPPICWLWPAAPASSLGVALADGAAGWRPVPRALGPPQEADPQALLQVFRT